MRAKNGWRLALCAMWLTLPACSGGEATTPGATITAAELAARIEAGDAPVVLDVRSEGEFAGGHIPGAVNIPHDQLATRIDELPTDHATPIVVHCERGGRAQAATETLQAAGFTQLIDLEGDMSGWREGDHPVE